MSLEKRIKQLENENSKLNTIIDALLSKKTETKPVPIKSEYVIKSQSDYDNRTQSCNLKLMCNIKVSPDDTESLKQLHTWNVSNCRDFNHMFVNCDIKSDITGWDMSFCRISAFMFENCFGFNQDISGWNMANCRDMSYMFKNCISFNRDISAWDVSQCLMMVGTFDTCVSFNQDISAWDIDCCRYSRDMFRNCVNLINKYKCKHGKEYQKHYSEETLMSLNNTDNDASYNFAFNMKYN